jgi:hypothetical protein
LILKIKLQKILTLKSLNQKISLINSIPPPSPDSADRKEIRLIDKAQGLIDEKSS